MVLCNLLAKREIIAFQAGKKKYSFQSSGADHGELEGKNSWSSAGPSEGVRVFGNGCFKWLEKRMNVKVVNVKAVNVNARSWHHLGV